MNTVTITGNVARDPELFTTDGGTKICKFTIGNSEYVNGENKNNGFFDFTTFNEQAEHVLANVKKGDRLIVTGRATQRSWENEEGDRRYKVEFIAEEVAASLRFNDVSITRKDAS